MICFTGIQLSALLALTVAMGGTYTDGPDSVTIHLTDGGAVTYYHLTSDRTCRRAS